MSHSQRTRSNVLVFAIMLVGLLVFNAWAFLSRQTAQVSVDQRDRKIAMADEVKSLQRQHADALVANSGNQNLLAQWLIYRATNKEPFPVLQREFLAQAQSHALRPGEKQAHVFVPEIGHHKLRIEIYRQKEQIFDQAFEVKSGRYYNIRFLLEDNLIRTTFPGHPVIETAALHFVLQQVDNDHNPRPVFVSPNQPSWRKGLVFFDVAESGVLCEFRFDSKNFDSMANLHEAVSVRITAESDGPMTAAADDRLTVIRLEEMARGVRKQMPFRYKDGCYIFE